MRYQRTASIVLAGSAHASAWAFSVVVIRLLREESRLTTYELGWSSEVAMFSPVVFTLVVLVCVVRSLHFAWALTATVLSAGLASLTGATFGLFLWPVVFLMGIATLFLVDSPQKP